MIHTGTGIAPARNNVLQNRLNRLFEETFGPFTTTQSPISEDPGAFTAWTPLCDIYETDKNIVIKMEIPEVKKENVSVMFDNNVLTVSGERKPEEGTGQSYHRQERIYGQFLRSFTLPPFVDTKNISAESKEGMLLVTLPKVEEAKAKQIEVKVE